MPHILEQTVPVRLDKNGGPAAFAWRDRMYRVAEVQDRWRLLGAWWDGEGEYTFYRVRAHDGGFYDLCYDHKHRGWKLNVVQD